MATIKDVAALAGVSFTTVSHVVNRSRPVSPAARERVEHAIRQLNYVPSGVARSLKGRATATIGLLVPNNTNPYFAELARGIETRCERNGYCVFLCNSDDDPQKQDSYLRVLREKRIDGLIIASAGEHAALAQGLNEQRVPLVVVDREMGDVTADLVAVDHEMGARLATQHLIDLGHQRIACISGPHSTVVSALRVAGFRRAMQAAGLAVAEDAIMESDFSSPGGYYAACRLFDGMRPTAIFAGNDMMGIGVLRAAAERGLRVPQDCSVIGFDDIELSRFVYPALSTVGESISQLGELAAQLLLDRISGGVVGVGVRRIVLPRVVVWESTARVV